MIMVAFVIIATTSYKFVEVFIHWLALPTRVATDQVRDSERQPINQARQILRSNADSKTMHTF